MTVLGTEIDRLRQAEPMAMAGRVESLRGMSVLVDDLPLPVGALVGIEGTGRGARPTQLGEVTGFRGSSSVVMTFDGVEGIRPGQRVRLLESRPAAPTGAGMMGRVVNGLGEPIDGLGPVLDPRHRALSPEPIGALARSRVTEHLLTGVRAIDLMTPVGKGQRLGIFAGPGVGKSTLLGQIARGTNADVSVIALLGERGREVPEFLHESLGERGLARSVLVVSTGDESPLMRLRAAKLACSIAEGFRDDGLDVLLMMDSVTRFAHARRQVGLSVGEPPSTRGYTPSVFAELPVLLERAGAIAGPGGANAGTITGLYTILVEGDDMTEPVADAARGTLDGHVILDRKLAQKGQFPAIDVLDSVSRVASAVADPAHLEASRRVVRMLALFKEVEELVRIGAYARGSDIETDVAIEALPAVRALLQQGLSERVVFSDARQSLIRISAHIVEEVRKRTEQRAEHQRTAEGRG